MTPKTTSLRPYATALLALALVACSGEDRPAATTTTGKPDPAASSGAPSPAPSNATDSPRSQPTRSALPGTPAPEPAEPGEAPLSAPPHAGLYRYSQKGESSIAFFKPDPEGTLRVERAVVAGRAQRQRQTRTISQSQELEQTYLFRDDAVLLEAATQRVYGQEVRCEFERPLRILVVPLEVGGSWTGTGECEGIEVTFSARVVRTEMRTVGSERINTFVIRSTYEAIGDGFTQRTTSTTWISPDYRLVVRTEQETDGRQGAYDFNSNLTEQLLSLTPE